MPLIERTLSPEAAAKAEAAEAYREAARGRGVGVGPLFAPDVDPNAPRPDWLAFADGAE